jgi:hypothetical protein
MLPASASEGGGTELSACHSGQFELFSFLSRFWATGDSTVLFGRSGAMQSAEKQKFRACVFVTYLQLVISEVTVVRYNKRWYDDDATRMPCHAMPCMQRVGL